MSLTLSGLNNNYNSNTNSLVSGIELEQISKGILSAAPVVTPANLDQDLSKINLNIFKNPEAALKVFGNEANANTQVIKQIATNRAGFDVNLSENALTAIESLNARAARAQAFDMANRISGKIHVSVEAPDFTNTKNVFSLNNAPQLFETGNLSKDRKGSNPFSLKTAEKNNKENNKELNLFV